MTKNKYKKSKQEISQYSMNILDNIDYKYLNQIERNLIFGKNSFEKNKRLKLKKFKLQETKLRIKSNEKKDLIYVQKFIDCEVPKILENSKTLLLDSNLRKALRLYYNLKNNIGLILKKHKRKVKISKKIFNLMLLHHNELVNQLFNVTNQYINQ